MAHKYNDYPQLSADNWLQITANFTVQAISHLRSVCKSFHAPLSEVLERRLSQPWSLTLTAVYSNFNPHQNSSHVLFQTRDGHLYGYAQNPASLGLQSNTPDAVDQLQLPPAKQVFCSTDATTVVCHNQTAYRIQGEVIHSDAINAIVYNKPFTCTECPTYKATITLQEVEFHLYDDGNVKYREQHEEFLLLADVCNIKKYDAKTLVLHTNSGEVFYYQHAKTQTPILLCSSTRIKDFVCITGTIFYLTQQGKVFFQTIPDDDSWNNIEQPKIHSESVKQLISDGHDPKRCYLLHKNGELMAYSEGKTSKIVTTVARVITENNSNAGHGIRTNIIEFKNGEHQFLANYGSHCLSLNLDTPYPADFREMQKTGLKFFDQKCTEINQGFLQRKSNNHDYLDEPEIVTAETKEDLYTTLAAELMLSDGDNIDELRTKFTKVFMSLQATMINFQRKHHGIICPPVSWFSIAKYMSDCYKNHETLDLAVIESDILFLKHNSKVETISPGQSIVYFIERMYHLEKQRQEQTPLPI